MLVGPSTINIFFIFNVEVTKVLIKIENGEVIWAKFSSFFSHVVDKHENLDNPIFNKCGHKDVIQPHKWLDKGT